VPGRSTAAPEPDTVVAKYIYLDVVGFTNGRSVEAQSDIVGALNDIARTALADEEVAGTDVIFLPTGDGLCIALLGGSIVYDAHLKIALRILEQLNRHNSAANDEMRKFEIRVGINENIDNRIVDINGQTNVAGAGISAARRVMDMADGSQLLAGQGVFLTLSQRERYMASFRPFIATAKHDQALMVYQYVQPPSPGLNTDVPAVFTSRDTESRLTPFAAYYFAHAIRNREFVLATHKRG